MTDKFCHFESTWTYETLEVSIPLHSKNRN
jgi:hypothetical protein